ncbi:cellulose 1,4-beta-cellobiosidase [Aureococcus anophagefferens]|nr:cellulose 1,4-beta-cellobiosidase [Aureococcus anophagefferens]
MALDPQSTLIQLESLKLEKTPPAIKPRRSRSAWCVLLVAVSCLAVGFVGGALFARLTRDGGDDDDDVAADASAADAAADAAVDADGAVDADALTPLPTAAAPAPRGARAAADRRAAGADGRRVDVLLLLHAVGLRRLRGRGGGRRLVLAARPLRGLVRRDVVRQRRAGAVAAAHGRRRRADGGPDGDAAAVGRGADGRASSRRRPATT